MIRSILRRCRLALCRRHRRWPSPRARRAPDFSVADSNGKSVKLVRLQGQVRRARVDQSRVPVRARAIRRRRMQALQKEAGAKDVVWLTVNSTNKSSSEYKTGAQMNAWMKDKSAAQKAILIDAHQRRRPRVRRQDHAAHVRHRSRGQDRLRRRDRRQAQRARIRPRRPRTTTCARRSTETLAGKPVTVASTTPYGCSVKY